MPSRKMKSKRIDLNRQQLALRQIILDMDVDTLRVVEKKILKAIRSEKSLRFAARTFHKTHFYYDPTDLAEILGLSMVSVDRYIDGFIRCVRTPGEDLAAFRQRQRVNHLPHAPLVERYRSMSVPHPKTWRFIDSRILIFLVMAPTQLKGHNKKFLKELRSELSLTTGIAAGKPQPITSTTLVRQWEISA